MFCPPPHACLKPHSGHPIMLPGDGYLLSQFPIFSSYCLWLGSFIATISKERKSPLPLASVQVWVPWQAKVLL